MKKTTITLFTLLLALVTLHAQYNIKTGNTSVSKINQNGLTIKEHISKLANQNLMLQPKNFDVLPVSNIGNMSSVSATPKALYRRPIGTYMTGLGSRGGALYPSYTGHGCADWRFINQSTNATSYSWDLNGTIFSTEANGMYNMKIGYYYMPTLTATGTGGTSTVKYGSKMSNQLCFAGKYFVPATTAQYYSDSTTNGTDFYIIGASTYGKYAFGSGLTIPTISSVASNAIYSFYEKPIAPLYVDSVYAFVYSQSNLPFPADGKLNMYLLKVNTTTGAPTTDTIAKSVCTKNDLIPVIANIFVVPFAFKDIDEFGFETTKGIIISDEFVVKIAGFSDAGFDLGFMTDYFNPSTKSAAFDIAGKTYTWKRNYNMHINLRAAFTTLYADEVNRTLSVTKEGGLATDKNGFVSSLYSTFLPFDEDGSKIWEVTKSDWLSLSYDTTYFDSNSIVAPVISASALPQELTSRTGEVNIKCRGIETKITVLQEKNTGNHDALNKSVVAFKTAGVLMLNYTQEYNKLEIFSLSGQLMESHELDNSGSFQHINRTLTSGTYILRVTGKSKPVSLKIVY